MSEEDWRLAYTHSDALRERILERDLEAALEKWEAVGEHLTALEEADADG